MKKFKKAVALLLSVLMLLSTAAIVAAAEGETAKTATNATYYNTATLSAADPAVMYDTASGYYYVYSTDGGGRQNYFGIYRSADLVTWELVGGAIPRTTPQWGNSWFWAPECYHNEETGWYFLFYAARMNKGEKALAHFGHSDFEEACKIGVAASRSPEGPFVNIAAQPIDYYPYDPDYYDINQIMEDQNTPPKTLEEGMTAPKGTYLPIIDPNVFFDDNGKIYMYFSRNCYRDWVWDPVLEKYLEEANIYCVELTSDWWNDPEAKTMPAIASAYVNSNKAEGDGETVRKDGFIRAINYAMEPQNWENAHIDRVPTNRRWAEGSTTIKYYFDKDGDGTKEPYYYLFYSCNNWENEWYGIGYAVSNSPLGPWDKYDLNPIIHLNDDMSGTGHGSIAFSPDGEEMFYVYHGRKGTTGSRRLFQDRMTIDETKIDEGTGLPTVSVLQTVTDQPVPSGVAPYTISADMEATALQAGETTNVSFNVKSSTGAALPLNSTLDRVVIESSDPNIACVDSVSGKTAVIRGNMPGQATITLKYQRKSADGTFYDVTNTIGEETAKAELTFDVTVSDEYYVNEPITYTVTTSKDIKALKLYNEKGGAIKLNKVEKLEDGDNVKWNITFAVGTAGDRSLTLKGVIVGGATVDVTTFTPKIVNPEAAINTVSAPESVLVYESFNVNINATNSVKTITLRNEKGAKLGKKLIAKTADGINNDWTYEIEIGTAGNRTITVTGADAAGSTASKSFNVSVVSLV